MAKLRPDQLPDATAGTKFAHVVNKQNTTDGPDGTSERLELSNLVGAIDPNHVFNTTAERDAYFTSNPSELQTGIYCVVNTPFAYFRYNGSAWVEQSGVVTGPKGDKGDSGDFSGLTNNTIPKVSGSDLADSPLSVDASGNVSMTGTFTADELKTNISSVTLGDQKKISGVGEGVEIVDLSHNKHKFIVTQQLAKTGDNRPFAMEEGDYQLVPIVTDTTNDITDPEFEFTTSLGDQNLYGFKVVPNGAQTNVVAQICRQGETKPIWSETYDSVGSDELDIDPVILDGNQTYKFSITGSYKGDSSGKMAYSIGARLSQKRYLLDERDRVNVDGVQTPNIVTGNGLTSEEVDGNVMLEVSGKTDVVELDVTLDATVTINNAYVGKVISIIQSGSPVAIPMQLTLSAHNAFETGDVIEIEASASYVNYYFSVYYYNANGVLKVVYPSNAVRLTRTEEGWNVQEDGRFTNVMLVNASRTTYSGDPIVDNAHPVSGFVFVDRSGVEFITDDLGKELLKVDIGETNNPAEPELKFIDLDSSYHDLSADKWGTVLSDNLPDNDIGYFRMSGFGASFNGLPESISLTSDVTYTLACEVSKGASAGFAQRISILSHVNADDANNRTIQRSGITFSDAKNEWSEVMLKRDAVAYSDMSVTTPEAFNIITAGDNMTGTVVDGVLTLSSTGGGSGGSDVTRQEFNALHDEVDLNTDRVLKLIEGTVILETYNLDDLAITDQMLNDASSVEDKARLFYTALYKSSEPNFQFYSFITDGDDFYGLLPNATGGIFQVISLSDQGERYVILQFKDRSGVTRTASINSQSEFVDFGSGSSGSVTRQEFDEVKDTADTAKTLATTAQSEAAANTIATAANSATLVTHAGRLDAHSLEITGLKAEDTSIKQRVRQIELEQPGRDAEVAAIKATTETHTTQIAGLDDNLLQLETTTNTKFDAVEQDLLNAQSAVQDLNQSQIEQDTKIDTLTSGVDGLDTSVNALIDEMALTFKAGEDLAYSGEIDAIDGPTRTDPRHSFKINGVEVGELYSEHFTVKNADPSKQDLAFKIDSNNNTQVDHIGQLYINRYDKNTGEKTQSLHIDADGYVKSEHAFRSDIFTNNTTKTLVSSNDHARYIDLRTDNLVKIGAKAHVEFNINGTQALTIYGNHANVEMRDNPGAKEIVNNAYLQAQIAGGGSSTNGALPVTTDMSLVIGADGTTLDDFVTDQTTFEEFYNFLKTAQVSAKRTWKFAHVVNDSSSIKQFTPHISGTSGQFFYTSLADNNNYADYQDTLGKKYLGCFDEFTSSATTYYWQSVEGVGVFKELRQPSSTSKTTYYAHNGDSHLDILNTGSGDVELDSMRVSTAQNEDRVKFKNNHNTAVNLRLGYDGSYTVINVLAGQTVLGWASREFGGWTHTKFFEDRQDLTTYVIGIDDFNWTTNSDPIQNTKNLISALPKNTVFVGYHAPDNSNNKFKIINHGTSSTIEGTKSTYHIIKQGNAHAVGLSTTEADVGSTAKCYSRILDGKRGMWFTSDTSSSFSLADDVPVHEMPEDKLVLTGDKGIMKTVVDESGVISLQEIEGYNFKELLIGNNLYQADLQTRFGPGTIEANDLTFTIDTITANNIEFDVDSITSNNLNGEN